MNLLVQRCKLYANECGRDDIKVEDIAQAMEDIGLIKPCAVIDPNDTHPNGQEGMNRFLEWCKGEIPERSRTVAMVSDTGNSILRNSTSNIDMLNTAVDEKTEKDASVDWLTALMNKNPNINQEEKLKDTVLGTMIPKSDPKIIGSIPGGPIFPSTD